MSVALRIPAVQTKLTAWVADYLSEELQSRIEIQKVYFRFFDQLQIRGLYVEDQEGDTLLYCDRLRVNLELLKLRDRVLEFDIIQLDEPRFYLKQYPDSGRNTNLDFIIEYFRPENSDTTQKQIAIYSDDLRLNSARFSLNRVGADSIGFGVDYRHLDVRNIFIDLEKVELLSDTLYAEAQHISFVDQSGFQLDSLAATVKISSIGMNFKGLKLRTPNSRIRTDLSFEYPRFSAFKTFVDSVYIQSDFRESDLNFRDISYFAPQLAGFSQQLSLEGKVRGVVRELSGSRLKVGFGNQSFFYGDCDLSGLPDFENTYINLNIRKLATNTDDLNSIQLPPFDENRYVSLPARFSALGTMAFSGEFIGFVSDFVAYGNLRSEIGSLRMDLGFSQDSKGGDTRYNGELISNQFDFGKLFGVDGLGKVTSAVKVKGKGLTLESLNTNVNGIVSSAIFRDYAYQDVQLQATLEKNLFNGRANINDANLSMDFDGIVDLRRDTARFDFISNLYHADLGALNLIESDGYSSLTSRIEVNIQAVSLDNFRGEAHAYATSYCIDDDGDIEYPIGDVSLRSSRSSEGRRIELSSSIADASVNGDFQTFYLPKSFANGLRSVLPSLIEGEMELSDDVAQAFDFQVVVKDFRMINELIIPAIDMGGGTTLKGSFDEKSTSFNLDFKSPFFQTGRIVFDSLNVSAEKSSDVAAVIVTSRRIPLTDSIYFEGIDFRAVAYQDKIEADMHFSDQNNDRSHIPLLGEILGPKLFEIGVDSANIYLLGERWHNDSLSTLLIDTTAFHFHDFRFTSGEREVMVEGTVSEAMSERLSFQIKDFDVALINPVTPLNAPDIFGIVNARGQLEQGASGRMINSELDWRGLRVGRHDLGNALFEGVWNFEKALLDIDGSLSYKGTENIDVRGTYNPRAEENPLQAVIGFEEFRLSILSEFIKTAVSEFEGHVNGTVLVSGDFSRPLFSGSLKLVDAGVKVDYLNTKYYLSDQVTVESDYIGFDYIPIKDQEGNEGFLIGTLFHDNFRNLNYNFYVEMDQLLCLNTTKYDNDLFYGKAYGSGTVDVSGYDSNVQIEVTAASNPGTYLYLPLGGPTEVSLERFVTFVTEEGEASLVDELDLSGITLLMDLQVTPDMQVELVFDESLGDVLRARGSGALNLEITPTGDFSMFGRYEIEQGDYQFTLQNIINKKFSIEKGGVIGWYGDPYNADIDVKAVYKTRASLADLMGEFAEGYTSRVAVELVLKLTNKLLNPNVDFSVRLPSADESMQNLVNSALSSEEEKNKQAFSLLVLNRFLPPSNRAASSSSGSLNIGATTSSELLSNQLSNWLSQISEDFNVGVNYRPGDNITNEELAVALSTQLLNDRLLLSGSFGVSNTPANISSETNNQVIGDFMAEYLITEEGKLRLKVFSESADYNILQTYRTGTIQGAGISYQEDFDNFADLACRLRNLLRKKGEKASCDDLY